MTQCVNVYFKGSHVNTDDGFYLRIAAARKALGLTQDQLAVKAGVVRRQIAAYEAGKSKPRENVLANLAAALGASTQWLATGEGEGPDVSNVRRTVTVRDMPVVSMASLTHFEPNNPNHKFSAIDFIPAPHEAGEFSFGVIVQGESMESWSGPSFPDGTIIVVDPEANIEDGDFGVFIETNSHQATFKMYTVDQGEAYLQPLNSVYPIFNAKDYALIGKVISAQLPLKSSPKSKYTNPEVLSPYGSDHELERVHERIDGLESKLDEIINLLNHQLKQPT